MTHPRKRTALVVLTMIGVVCAATLVPTVVAPAAAGPADLAQKVTKALKIAKRADKNAKQALAELDAQTPTPGPPGPAGPQGVPGPQGPPAHRIDVTLANGADQDVAVGPWTLSLSCTGATAATRRFGLGVTGGNGGVQGAGTRTVDDSALETTPFAAGAFVPEGNYMVIGSGDTSGHFYRMNGSMVLHDDLGVATVVYDMFLENRQNQGTCHFRGTGVQSGRIR